MYVMPISRYMHNVCHRGSEEGVAFFEIDIIDSCEPLSSCWE